MVTWPFWLVIGAILVAIDLGAKRTSRWGEGKPLAAGVGALAGAGIALAGVEPIHQMLVAALVGSAAVLIVPKIGRAHHRSPARTPPLESAVIFFGEDGAPRVELASGVFHAQLEDRGQLEEEMAVQVLERQGNIAIVRPLHRPNGPPPPPLSRCRMLR